MAAVVKKGIIIFPPAIPPIENTFRITSLSMSFDSFLKNLGAKNFAPKRPKPTTKGIPISSDKDSLKAAYFFRCIGSLGLHSVIVGRTVAKVKQLNVRMDRIVAGLSLPNLFSSL